MSLPLLDVVVMAAYLIISVGFGCWFVVRSRNPNHFTSAGGRIPMVIVGLSLFGTYISSISFLGYAGMAFSSNWNTYVLSLALPVPVIIAVKWFIPFYRNFGSISTYCHLEERFGVGCRIYATLCYMLTQIARMGAVMYLLALPIYYFTGWNMVAIILVTGIVTTIYSTLGGIEGVVWTDALQSAILIFAALWCVVAIPLQMPEGPGQIFQIAAEHHKFSLGSMSANLGQSTFWVVLIYGIVINLQNFGIDQNFVQRYLTARSEKEAKRSLWLCTMITIPINACFFFIGTALFAYYTAKPDLLTPDLAADIAAGKGDGVFPYFIVHGIPSGVTGLVIAAIFAAAMSTISASLNGCATLTLTDFYVRFFRPQAGSRESMATLYLSSIVWGILGMTAAILMTKAKNILDVWWTVSGIVSGGMLGLFLLGFLSKKAGNVAAWAGIIAGVAALGWMTLSLPQMGIWSDQWSFPRSPFHQYLIPVVGTLTVLFVGFLFTCRSSGNREIIPLDDFSKTSETK